MSLGNVEVVFNEAGFGALLARALPKALMAYGEVVQNSIVEGMGSNHGGEHSRPGAFPHTQTGQLRASFRTVLASPDEVRVGSTLPYARYLNDGAVISPKNGKALAIPLSDKAKRLIRLHGSPRAAITAMKAMGKVGFVNTSKGVLVTMEQVAVKRGVFRTARAGSVWFLLTSKTIFIPPRPWAKLSLNVSKWKGQRAFAASMRRSLGVGGVA